MRKIFVVIIFLSSPLLAGWQVVNWGEHDTLFVSPGEFYYLYAYMNCDDAYYCYYNTPNSFAFDLDGNYPYYTYDQGAFHTNGFVHLYNHHHAEAWGQLTIDDCISDSYSA